MSLIKDFQQILKQKQIDAYIIPTCDYHNSEYVSAYFKSREYLSNFTGSAGTLVVTQTNAYLWTDGRYHIQAAKEIDTNTITLMKQGIPGVPTMIELLKSILSKNETLGFDGKVIPTSLGISLKTNLPYVNFKTGEDLIAELWPKRPKLPFSMLYRLDSFFAGKSFEDKLSEIKNKMKALNCDTHIITSLEDQAWLYNLRADDVPHTPVFLAYTIVLENQCYLFINKDKIDKTVEKYLKDNNVIVSDYFEFYEFIKTIKDKKILVDFNKINYEIYNAILEKNKLTNAQDPSLLLKAIKNETEIKNIKLAHIKDGVAMVKFLHYVKTKVKYDETLSEISVTNVLENYRREQKGFVDISFNTICAYKEHAAMMHYSAKDSTNYQLKPEGFLLVDSGGHYLEGSTDITRTICLGKPTPEMKLHYTTVLKSVIALSEAVFLKGVKGVNLDILARGPIWKLLIDYKCGTGHGIGYLLSVHEAPNGFRWQIVPERNDSAVLQEGMITTNEPGIYLENQYGIRIENELLCITKGKSEFGDFLGFETITYCPIDLDAIDTKLLTHSERVWIDSYHKNVYDTLSPYLNKEDLYWLRENTKPIK